METAGADPNETEPYPPIWDDGLTDGWGGRPAEHPQDSDYVDGYITGQAEKELGVPYPWTDETSD